MAFHNVNFGAVPMPVGTYNGTGTTIGDNVTASTIHEIYCLSAGTAIITALGGGTFTWSGTPGQNVHVMCGQVVISSGIFVGFKIAFGQFISR